MSGTFVAVVGSSGVGKDTIMAYARARLGDELVVVRRVVTRDSDGGSEDHDSMSIEQFEAAESEGHFALAWSAHGLRYGLPAGIDGSLLVQLLLFALFIPLVRDMLPQKFALAERPDTGFDSVIGAHEAKAALQDIVSFLNDWIDVIIS